MSLAAYGATRAGRREQNEDALRVDVSTGLAVVADGLGGHRAGVVASELAVSTIARIIADTAVPTGETLRLAALAANAEILDAAHQSADRAGMGTTVSAVLVRGGRFAFLSVGDSRIYRWRDGELHQLTEDDSWIAHIQRTDGPLSDEGARLHPLRHVLTNALGLDPGLHIGVQTGELSPDDVLVLCTDGLHGTIDHVLLAQRLQAMQNLGETAEALIDEALALGSTDNVSVILVRSDPRT